MPDWHHFNCQIWPKTEILEKAVKDVAPKRTISSKRN